MGYTPRSSSFLRSLTPLFVLVVALALFLWAVSGISRRSQEENLRCMTESVRRAAVECYALEGQYPPDFLYLKEHYGIALSDEKYKVYYEYLAPNLMPDISVLPLSPEEGGLFS